MNSNDINCNQCRYLHQLKRFIPGGWEYGHCCTVLPETENEGYEDFAMVIEDPQFDKCEMFVKRTK